MTELNSILDKFRNDKKLIIIFLAGLAGVALLLFSGGTECGIADNASATDTDTADEGKPYICTVEETENLLASKVEKIVSAISGTGDVSASVTIASSARYVYAENIKTENADGSESADRELVIVSDDNAEPAVLICIQAPEITGVAVVCSGGGSAVVKAEIVKLVTALFGIGADKVYVGNKS